MVDRKMFIDPIPQECTNTKQDAPSTLTCRNDIWGTMPEHSRYINQKDENGNIIMREDNPSKPQKKLAIIGNAHIEWQDYFIKIRINAKQSMWYKHWAVAVNMHHFGKLPENAIAWVKEEGEKRFQNGLLPIRNTLGKYTLGISALLSLGVLTKHGDDVILTSSINRAKEAVKNATEITTKEIVKEEESLTAK